MNKNFNLKQLEKNLKKINTEINSFDFIRIMLASPKKIKSWCQKKLPNGQIIGEVLKLETLHSKTKVPITGGLFCQKIFGPISNWRCRCGKYSGIFLSKICTICGVQITESRIRRYKMGYIKLPTPVSHFWYFKNNPAFLKICLRLVNPLLTDKILEKMIYYYEYKKEDDTDNIIYEKLNLLTPKKFISRREQLKQLEKNFLKKKKNKNIDNSDNIDNIYNPEGAEEILNILRALANCLEDKINWLRNKTPKNFKNFRTLRLLESFFSTGIKMEWMILTVIPVLPPSLRPLVQTENSKIISADANNFYIEIFERIAKYKTFMKKYNLKSDYLAFHQKRLIQYGTDALIDNSKLPENHILSSNNRPLKSLTEVLEGKFGRFRQNLLGKRVDYSGRSVIVVEPDLQLNEFGLPYNIAAELFNPYLLNVLAKSKLKKKIKNRIFLKYILAEKPLLIWKLLEKLIENFSLLLNRAPTLHKFGIQAFSPILIPSKAILLHPLLCTGFNADFDGDQMAIHLPLYNTAQLEAQAIMRPSFNILSPSNGNPILKPSQDMIIGCYYLSLFLLANKNFNNFCFSNEEEALNIFYQKKISIHTSIYIRYPLASLKIKIKKKKLFLYFSKIFAQKLKIFKTLKLNNTNILLFTNVGIFLAIKINLFKYKISEFFLNTTPGRLLLNTTFKNFI